MLSLLLFLYSCKNQERGVPVDRAFYYWKSKLSFTAKEAAALQQLKITKLYVKLFDVNWDDEKQSIQPVARVDMDTAALHTIETLGINFIPVVFITNESLQTIDSAGAIELANKVIKLVTILQQKEKLHSFDEFQLDCDWTASTKQTYFFLVDEVKKQMKLQTHVFAADAKLSATIRLHQIKFSNKTGVPKVDKGLLMCYNMGNLKNPSVTNSIIETAEMKKYLSSVNSYRLPLDIALPLFDWAVYFSNNTYKGILSNINTKEYAAAGKQTGNEFTFTIDTAINNIPFAKGDRLRIEESSRQELAKAIDYLQNKLWNNEKRTVSFYHLDELILNKHPQDELETFYNSFH